MTCLCGCTHHLGCTLPPLFQRYTVQSNSQPPHQSHRSTDLCSKSDHCTPPPSQCSPRSDKGSQACLVCTGTAQEDCRCRSPQTPQQQRLGTGREPASLKGVERNPGSAFV